MRALILLLVALPFLPWPSSLDDYSSERELREGAPLAARFPVVQATVGQKPWPHYPAGWKYLVECRDSVIRGGDGVAGSGDEWPVMLKPVTNTSDIGVGGLQEAFDWAQSNPKAYKFIYFTQSTKYFRDGAELRLNAQCVVITGANLQGQGMLHMDGIQIRDGSHQVLIDHMRAFKGSNGFFTSGGTYIAYNHLTSMFFGLAGGQYQAGFSGDTSSIAVGAEGLIKWFGHHYGMYAHSLYTHPTVMNAGSGEPRIQPATEFGFHWKNYSGNTGHRMPQCQSWNTTILHQIVHNWRARASEMNNSAICNYAYGLYVPGPAQNFGGTLAWGDGCGDPEGRTNCATSLYWTHNAHHKNGYNGDGSSDLDDWIHPTDYVIWCRDIDTGNLNECSPDDGPIDPNQATGLNNGPRRRTGFSYIPEIAFDPKDLMHPSLSWGDTQIDSMGVNALLTCEGVWRYSGVRVPWETSVINDFKSRTGRTRNDTLANITIPNIPVVVQCADTDGDMMPDGFENLCVGHPTNMSVDGDLGGNGYLNIEEYIFGLNSYRKIVWDDNSDWEGGFEIWRDGGTGFVLYATVGPNVTEYFDVESRPGYRYKVRAISGSNISAFSNDITAVCN